MSRAAGLRALALRRVDLGGLDLRPLITAAVVLPFALLVGLRLADAALVALVAGVVALALVTSDAGQEWAWPREREEEAPGVRRDVAALSWTFIGRGDGRVAESAVRRLRTDTQRRLARSGVVLPGGLGPHSRTRLDPDTAARVRGLVGERAWHVLTAPGGTMPTLADVAHCVGVVERLGESATPDPSGAARPAAAPAPPTEGTAP